MMHSVAQQSGVATTPPPARDPGPRPGTGPGAPPRSTLSLRKLWSDARGLSTVEYVIVLVLIAAVAIGAWKAFGKQVQCAIARTDREMPRFADGELGEAGGGGPCPNVGDGSGSGTRGSRGP
jgi:Flp pilus assembly pilin Flp